MEFNIDTLRDRLDDWTSQGIEYTDPVAIRSLRDELSNSNITMQQLVNLVNSEYREQLPVAASESFIKALLDSANTTTW